MNQSMILQQISSLINCLYYDFCEKSEVAVNINCARKQRFMEHMIISVHLVDISMKISCQKETGFVGHAVLIVLLRAERFCHE